MFIGYASNSVAYIFLVLKSNVLECNTIIETKNANFFEHIFPLFEKISHTPKEQKIGYITEISEIGQYRYDFVN